MQPLERHSAARIGPSSSSPSASRLPVCSRGSSARATWPPSLLPPGSPLPGSSKAGSSSDDDGKDHDDDEEMRSTESPFHLTKPVCICSTNTETVRIQHWMCFFKAVMCSLLIYDCESWSLSEKVLYQINGTNMSMLMSFTVQTQNQDICKLTISYCRT